MTTKEATSMVCVESFHSGHGFFRRGQVVSSDSPAVRDSGQFFVPFGTPEDQWPQPSWEALDKARHERETERLEQERIAFETEARLNPIKIAGPELVKAQADHVSRLYGRPCLVRKGSVVTADHDLVSQNPDLWKPC